LQGVVGYDKKILLTDPAINSKRRVYGNTDMGQAGI